MFTDRGEGSKRFEITLGVRFQKLFSKRLNSIHLQTQKERKFYCLGSIISGFPLRESHFALINSLYCRDCCKTPNRVVVTIYKPIDAGIPRTKAPIIITKKIFIDHIILLISGIPFVSIPGSFAG